MQSQLFHGSMSKLCQKKIQSNNDFTAAIIASMYNQAIVMEVMMVMIMLGGMI